MRQRTISDTPLERQIYERAAREQEAYIVEVGLDALQSMPPPPGWYSRGKIGRPPKVRPGGQEEFHWTGLVVALLLKQHYDIDYRRMAAHLAANPDLCDQLDFPRAPSHSTLQRAHRKLKPGWLKELNNHIVEPPKKTNPEGQEANTLEWIQLDLPL